MKCVLGKYHAVIDQKRNVLEVDKIINRLIGAGMMSRNLVNNIYYDNIKALLDTCNEIAKYELGPCLVENNNRFGLKERSNFMAGVILKMTLKDLLKEGVNRTICQNFSSAPLKDIYDVFVIEFISVVRMV